AKGRSTMRGWKTRAIAALASASLAFAPHAWAWGPEGHMTVGAIADAHIKGKRAAKEVARILGPGMTLRAAAVWADCAKGVVQKDDGPFHYTGAGKYKECAPFETAKGKAAMVDFVKNNWEQCKPVEGEELCHKQYHYADVAIERDAYKQGLVG